MQTAPSPARARDVADLERELRGSRERIAALVHGRRSGVSGLTAPGDAMTLDAEGPQHDPEREVERLEDGALLDVQLEVGRGGVQLRAGTERRVEVDAVRADRVGERHAVSIRELP